MLSNDKKEESISVHLSLSEWEKQFIKAGGQGQKTLTHPQISDDVDQQALAPSILSLLGSPVKVGLNMLCFAGF